MIRRTVRIELASIAAASALFLTVVPSRPITLDLVLAATAIAYVVLNRGRTRRIWEETPTIIEKNTTRSYVVTSVFTIVALCALISAALSLRGGAAVYESVSSWRPFLVLLFYVPWALAQQYVFLAFFFGRLLVLAPVPVAISILGGAFSLVHYPHIPLMVLTALAGVFWAWIYLETRRLAPIVMSHAVLSTALYYLVFGEDLLASWGLVPR